MAMGRTPESSSQGPDKVVFDDSLVGKGGAGYVWVPAEGFDVQRFSIAPPKL